MQQLDYQKNKVYSKLASQANKNRKNTIDVESYLKKNPTISGENQQQKLKRGYYAKLGIERSPTINPSMVYRNSNSTFKSQYQEKKKKEDKPPVKHESQVKK